MNLFELLYDSFKFDKNKPIRLFEAFSGIGTQGMALKRLGCNIEYVGISEIDRFALESYYAIHGKGIKNYGGVGEFDKFPKDIDIITWSFPCQDISLAGKQKGMVDGSRSNYGYVFLDMIENMDFADRPKVMLMENVRALFSKTFENDLLLYYYNDIYYSANEKYYKTGDLIVVDKENKAYILTKNNQLFRIRRLTPSETWRLMGISDEDFYKAFNDGVSDSQLYKQAGNAIVVDVLYYIFKEMIE